MVAIQSVLCVGLTCRPVAVVFVLPTATAAVVEGGVAATDAAAARHHDLVVLLGPPPVLRVAGGVQLQPGLAASENGGFFGDLDKNKKY